MDMNGLLTPEQFNSLASTPWYTFKRLGGPHS